MPFCTKLRAFLFLFIILSTKVFSQPLSTIYPKNNEVISENSVEFKWNKLNGSISYQLLIAEDANFTVNPVTHSGILTNSFILNNLQKGKSYFWKVRGYNGATYSAYSNIAYFINFTPSMVPNIKLWLRADSSCILSGSNVSQWHDLSGQNNNFAQVSSSAQPIQSLSIASLNNKKVITFDGNDELDGGDILDMNTTSWSYFLFGKSNGVDGTYLGKTIYAAYPNRFALVYLSSQLNVLFNSNLSIITNHSPGNYELISYLIDRNSNIQKIFVNTQPVGQTYADGTSYDHSNDLPFKIGSYNGGPLNLNGDISEIIVYNNNLNDSVKKVVNDYFYYRYYGSPVDLGEDIFVTSPCNPILDAGSRFSSFLWSDGSTGQQLQANQTGEYWVQATDPYGNKSYDTVVVEFPDKLADTLICHGNSVTLNPQIIGTYLWSTNETSQTITVNTAGDYWVHITSGSCSKYDTVRVSVDDFSLLASLGADDSLCVGNYIGLTSPYPLPGGLSYQWSTLDTSPTISITNSGTYAVTVTNANGCVASDAVYDTILGVAPSVHFNAMIGCSGSTSNFVNHSIPSGSIWEWDFGDGSPHAFTSNAAHVYSNGGNFTVRLTLTDGICSNYIDSLIHVPANPIAGFSGSTACISNLFTFYDQSSCTEGTITSYDWDFGDGFPHEFTSDAPHTYNTIGNLTVSLTIQSSFGCVASVQHQITVVNSAPSPSAFSLYLPTDNFSTPNHSIDFAWNSSIGASTYSLQYSTDPLFNGGVTTISNIDTNYYSMNISTSNTYFWRVISYGICGDFYISNVFSFTIFTPSEITGMQQWLKADTNVLLNGHAVLEWGDCSGNYRNVAQSNPNSQPTLQQNSLNGYPAIKFNGTTYLSGGNILNIGDQSWTYFIVGKSNLATGTYLGKTYYGTAINRYAIFYNNNIFTAYCDDSYQIISPRTPSNYEIISWKIDRSSTQQFLYFNGTQYTSASAPAASLNITSSFPFTVGSYNNSNLFLNGEIAEVIIYNQALSDSNLSKIEKFLSSKYAPPVNLGPDVYKEYGMDDVVLDAGARFASFLWSTGEVTQSIHANQSGEYSVIVSNIFGELSYDTIKVTLPHINISDTAFCLGTPLNLPANPQGAYTYLWLPDSLSQSTIEISAPGNYGLVVKDTAGYYKIKNFTVVADSFAIQASLGPDKKVCKQDYIGLVSGSSQATQYLWSDGSSNSLLVVNNPLWSQTQYSVTVTSNNGCVMKDSILVKVNGIKPTADFISDSACQGSDFHFINSSSIISPFHISQYNWDFADGHTSPLANPTHVFSGDGVYNVKLTVTSDSGCISIAQKTAKSFSYPQSSFLPFVGCRGVPFNFIDKSICNIGNINAWHWNFNDPHTSGMDTTSLQNPIHAYDSAGSFIVSLITSTDKGCADTTSQNITVKPAPSVDFTASPACEGKSVFFDDIITTESWNQVQYFNWHFGDGDSSASSNPVHVYYNPGSYPVTFHVVAANGCRVNKTDTLIVESIPMAYFDFSKPCTDNLTQFVDATQMANGTINQWKWISGNTVISTQQNPAYMFSDTGIHWVRLVVSSENQCQDSITLQVKIYPGPHADFTVSPEYGIPPLNAQFTNLSSGASQYLWQFGDGEDSFDFSPDHTYYTANVYPVVLYVSNDFGCSDSLLKNIYVIPTTTDVAVKEVQASVNNGRVSVIAQILNNGTRKIEAMDLSVDFGNGNRLHEMWNGILDVGEEMFYSFNVSSEISDEHTVPYVCVTAELPGLTDENIADNRKCEALTEEYLLLNPYPNPAFDKVALPALLPYNGDATINIVNEIGSSVYNGTAENLMAGYQIFSFDVSELSKGIYTINVTYRDKMLSKKFMKR